MAGGALSPASGASGRLLPLLLGLASRSRSGAKLRPCLRNSGPAGHSVGVPAGTGELPAGAAGGCLGLLRALLGREGPAQPLSLLLALALRNALVIQAGLEPAYGSLLTAGDSSMEGGPWNWTLAGEGEVHLQPQAPSWPAAEGRASVALRRWSSVLRRPGSCGPLWPSFWTPSLSSCGPGPASVAPGLGPAGSSGTAQSALQATAEYGCWAQPS